MTGDSAKMTKEGSVYVPPRLEVIKNGRAVEVNQRTTACPLCARMLGEHRAVVSYPLEFESEKSPWICRLVCPDAATTEAAPVVQFVECATCAAKQGSPTLCADCLHRRRAYERSRGAPEAPTPLPIGHAMDAHAMDEAFKRVFSTAALKERDRMNFGPPELDASMGPGMFVGRREVYTRAVAMLGDIEVIPGVELRVDEILDAMLPTVRACAQDAIGEVRLAIATLDDRRPIMVHAQRLAQLTERYITLRCPGRRYFIEVGNDREGWIQVCTPAPNAATEAA